MNHNHSNGRVGLVALAALGAALPGIAAAGTIDPCDGSCTWSIMSGGVQVAAGAFEVDPNTGDIGLADPVKVALGGGAWAGINSLSGNSDPILNFNIAAATGANGRSLSFTFSLPTALSGVIDTSSSVAYSLTSKTATGAQLTPLKQHVLVAQDVDTAVGGLPPLNAGVDVGDRFFFTGAGTQRSPTYTAENSRTADSAYDLMSVTLGFALSPNSSVGATGFVQEISLNQNPVPLPASAWLLGLGLLGVALHKNRPSWVVWRAGAVR